MRNYYASKMTQKKIGDIYFTPLQLQVMEILGFKQLSEKSDGNVSLSAIELSFNDIPLEKKCTETVEDFYLSFDSGFYITTDNKSIKKVGVDSFGDASFFISPSLGVTLYAYRYYLSDDIFEMGLTFMGTRFEFKVRLPKNIYQTQFYPCSCGYGTEINDIMGEIVLSAIHEYPNSRCYSKVINIVQRIEDAVIITCNESDEPKEKSVKYDRLPIDGCTSDNFYDLLIKSLEKYAKDKKQAEGYKTVKELLRFFCDKLVSCYDEKLDTAATYYGEQKDNGQNYYVQSLADLKKWYESFMDGMNNHLYFVEQQKQK